MIKIRQLLFWEEAFSLLGTWVPHFFQPVAARDFGFDCVMALLAQQPGGLTSFADSIPDWDGHFLEICSRCFARQAREVLVFPDCGDTTQLPAVMPLDLLTRFITSYNNSGMDLLGNGRDVLFAFDTGDLILADHDERVWLSGTTIPS